MSKKLMLNKYSANGLMPVTDGLICWLDGKDYKGGGIVKDRINKKEFTVNNVTNKNGAFLYNQSDSTIFTNFSQNDYMYDLFKSDFTMCFEEQASVISGYPRLITTGTYSVNSPYQLLYQPELQCMHFYNNKISAFKCFTNINICNNFNKKSIVVTKSGNNISFYLDNIKYENIVEEKDTNLILDRLTIGNTYLGHRTYSGYIYSFMAYNRALTKEEIQQNYLYEQSIQRGDVIE